MNQSHKDRGLKRSHKISIRRIFDKLGLESPRSTPSA